MKGDEQIKEANKRQIYHWDCNVPPLIPTPYISRKSPSPIKQTPSPVIC